MTRAAFDVPRGADEFTCGSFTVRPAQPGDET